MDIFKGVFVLSVLVILGLVAGLTGCQDEEGARSLLEKQGYQKVEICGANVLSCGEGDFYRTCFRAEMNGKTISGTVCSGLLFKGSTIRFDD